MSGEDNGSERVPVIEMGRESIGVIKGNKEERANLGKTGGTWNYNTATGRDEYFPFPPPENTKAYKRRPLTFSDRLRNIGISLKFAILKNK